VTHQLLVLIHLIGAIFFVGAIALEVLCLNSMRKHLGEDLFQKVEFLLFRRIKRVYPLFVLPMYAIGFHFYFQYAPDSWEAYTHWLGTHFGAMLTLKAVLALVLLGVFLTSPFTFMRPQPNKLKHFFVITGDEKDMKIEHFKFIHYGVFALGLLIVILAKMMFVS